MDIAVWTTHGVDRLRRRRLAMGGMLGAAIIAGVVAVSFLAAPVEAEPADEKVLEVKLAEAPEPEPELEPEPEPEPPPVANQPPPPVNQRVMPSLKPPTEVSDAPLTEAEPTDSNPYEGDPYANGVVSSGARRAPPKVEEKPAPPPPPKAVPRGPMRVTENVTPPKSLSQGAPSYPSSAKQAGIEGTVIIKYVVTETGKVTNVQVVRGPAELRQACIDAVSQWTFEPAMYEGRPVAVFRIARFPFRITT